MSKKSFNDIEHIIKNAIEVNEPAFKEASWTKMEALLDKGEDRKRPFIFWLWFLVPLLIVTGGIGYFMIYKNDNAAPGVAAGNTNNATPVTSAKQKVLPRENNSTAMASPGSGSAGTTASLDPVAADKKTAGSGTNISIPVTANAGTPPIKTAGRPAARNNHNGTKQDALYAKNTLSDHTKAKMKGSVTAASAEAGDDLATNEKAVPVTVTTETNSPLVKQEEDVVVVKIETDTRDEKKIEKIIDSVIAKTVNDKKDKTRISRFFIVVAGGAEGSGTKLFSVDKITGRAGLAAGYNFNKNLSAQAGFFVSNKKYTADGSSYKTKPGTYWNIVDISEVEANCRVYEIPVQVNYNFTPGKKLNIFGSIGLSSYIMKKEDYSFYYTRYGVYHKADAYYSGNKSLFSVLRISGGVEKKVGKQLSVFAAPGISIPLGGVGEGEVKLYSTEIMIGLKFTPSRRNK